MRPPFSSSSTCTWRAKSCNAVSRTNGSSPELSFSTCRRRSKQKKSHGGYILRPSSTNISFISVESDKIKVSVFTGEAGRRLRHCALESAAGYSVRKTSNERLTRAQHRPAPHSLRFEVLPSSSPSTFYWQQTEADEKGISPG